MMRNNRQQGNEFPQQVSRACGVNWCQQRHEKPKFNLKALNRNGMGVKSRKEERQGKKFVAISIFPILLCTHNIAWLMMMVLLYHSFIYAYTYTQHKFTFLAGICVWRMYTRRLGYLSFYIRFSQFKMSWLFHIYLHAI